MTRVIRSEDCGNSPKNIFVQELTIALATKDAALILSSVSDDIRWDIVGREQIHGKERLADRIGSLNPTLITTLTIHHVMTHGKAGSVNGIMQLQDGGSTAFCDVYEFTNAKGTAVCAITSYRIDRR